MQIATIARKWTPAGSDCIVGGIFYLMLYRILNSESEHYSL